MTGRMNVFKRLMQAVDFKAGDEVEFTIESNRFVRYIEFSPLIALHIPAAQPVFYPNYQHRLAKIIVNGKTLDKWALVFDEGGLKRNLACKIQWATSSDLALANPPYIESWTKMLVYAHETVKKDGLDTRSFYKPVSQITFTCLCGKTYNKVVDKCNVCGKQLTEGEICEKV